MHLWGRVWNLQKTQHARQIVGRHQSAHLRVRQCHGVQLFRRAGRGAQIWADQGTEYRMNVW